jgi:hypothetical protein
VRAMIGLVGMIVLAVAGCDHVGYGIKWNLVQQLGGIRIDSAVVTGDGDVRVFLKCNIAGVESVTAKPTLTNSTNGVSSVQTFVRDTSVAFTLLSSLGFPGQCPPVDIRVGSRRTLHAYYQDSDGTKHPLGVVEVR